MIILSMYGGGTVSGGGGGTPPPYTPSPAVSGKIYDPGGSQTYPGFPYSGVLPDGKLISVCKRAVSHADTGPLMFGISENGISYTWSQVLTIQCAALTMNVLSSGRILIAYQDNDGTDTKTYQEVKIVYSDNGGANWTLGDSHDFNDPDYITSILGRPLQLPSGKVLIPYYRYPSHFDYNLTNTTGSLMNIQYTSYPGLSVVNTTLGAGLTLNVTAFVGSVYPEPGLAVVANPVLPSLSQFFETTDGGQTITLGGTILSQPGGSFPNGYVTEVGWSITHNTGSDATTKIVALFRNEEYGFFTHVKSADGGSTWTEDTTNLVYLFGSGGAVPVDIVKRGGQMILICGCRKFPPPSNTFVGEVRYAVCTPDELFNNDQTVLGIGAPTTKIFDALSTVGGSGQGIDFGYPSGAVDSFGDVVVHIYDQSDLSIGSGTDHRTMIYQLVIP